MREFLKPLLPILLIGILIRLLVMPFFFHPDIKEHYFHSSFLRQGVTDIYSYIDQNQENLVYKVTFNYYPAFYFTLGSYRWLISPLLGSGFDQWLNDGSQSMVSQVGVYRYLFLMKVPYLIIDLLIGMGLVIWGKDLVTRRRILKIWLFNPFSLILIYVFSNFDILVAGLTVASLAFVLKRRWILAAMMLGVGAAFKAYPLLLLPWVVMAPSRWRDRILALFVGLGVFFVTLLPFLNSVSFRESALISGLTTRLFFPNIPIGFDEFLMPAIIGISIMLFWGMQSKLSPFRILVFWTGVLLLVLAGIHYHVSWLLWVAPLICLTVGLVPRLGGLAVCLSVLAMLIPFLYNDRSMNWSTLAVIDPIFLTIPIPFSAVERIYNPFVVMGALHSLLFGGVIVYLWQLWRSDEG